MTIHVPLDHPADFENFRSAARKLVGHNIDPAEVTWGGAPGGSLFGDDRPIATLPDPIEPPRASKAFVTLAQTVVCHKDASRFALLHRLLQRLQADRALLKIASDPDVARAHTLEKNVRRCAHKMKAFVRFRLATDPDGGERYVAWFEPEHHTLDRTAGFFVRRFPEMRWSILTPTRSAHWDLETLTMGDGADKSIAPDGDVNEDLWRTYFGAIFNPARLKVQMMQSEMPKRYWKNMPEGEMIAPLIRGSAARTSGMIGAEARTPARSTRIAREKAAETAALPTTIDSLAALRAAANHCTRCPLHGPATQVVVGRGPPNARLMFVGEQPGDQEDLAGAPFVGPAGQLFDRALIDAGINRDDTFVTNAVKHFKFEPRGKRRIHKSPNVSEIEHCRFWLDHERALVRPKLTVALGASAVRALSGKSQAVSKLRGAPLTWPDGSPGFVTVHPSYLLRVEDAARPREYERFVHDLVRLSALLEPVASAH
ncbi:MAG: UdgX family uracil-DNA binding protein [Pseudomonadota bacterium]